MYFYVWVVVLLWYSQQTFQIHAVVWTTNQVCRIDIQEQGGRGLTVNLSEKINKYINKRLTINQPCEKGLTLPIDLMKVPVQEGWPKPPLDCDQSHKHAI